MGAIEMTDEELSELAECLQDACEEDRRRGVIIKPARFVTHDDCNCPLGALLGTGYPYTDVVTESIGLSDDVAHGFIRGFDGAEYLPLDDLRAYDLGRLFREQYK